jgi:hypothetical protein
MEFWSKFQTYFRWALAFPFMPDTWMLPRMQLLGLLMLAAFGIALFRWRQTVAFWRRSNWLVFTQLLFYPLIIAVGAAYAAEPAPRDGLLRPNQTGEHLLDVLSVVPLITACFWIYWMKGARWLALGVVLFQQVVLLGGLFIAGMAVSGDWI